MTSESFRRLEENTDPHQPDAPIAVLVHHEPGEVRFPTTKPRCGGCSSLTTTSGNAAQILVAWASRADSDDATSGWAMARTVPHEAPRDSSD